MNPAVLDALRELEAADRGRSEANEAERRAQEVYSAAWLTWWKVLHATGVIGCGAAIQAIPAYRRKAGVCGVGKSRGGYPVSCDDCNTKARAIEEGEDVPELQVLEGGDQGRLFG